MTFRRTFIAAGLLSAAACSGDGPSLPPLTSATARLTVMSGDDQQATVGAELPEAMRPSTSTFVLAPRP